jgi:ATP synthase protein I
VQGSDRGKQIKTFARIGALGIELAASTVIGLLGGQWLDGKLGTEPWLSIAGLVLGVIAGFKSLYQTAKKHAQNTAEKANDSDEQDRR